MTRRLDPTAREIHVPKLADHDVLVGFLATITLTGVVRGRRSRFLLLDDAKEGAAFVGDAFGRDVDVAGAREGCGGDVEDFLVEEPLD